MIREELRSLFTNKSFSEKAFYILLAALWTRNIVFLYLSSIVSRVFNIAGVAHNVISVIFTVLVLLALPFIIKEIRITDIAFYLIIVSVYLYYMKNPYDGYVRLYLEENSITIIFTTMSYFLVGICVSKREEIKSLLYITSIISVVIDIIALGLLSGFMRSTAGLNEGGMAFAYWLLPPLCYTVLYSLKYHNYIGKIISILGFIVLLSLGNRGSVLCFIVCLIFYELLINQSKNKRTRHLLLLFCAVFFLVTIDFWATILDSLFSLFNVNTRVFELLKDNSFFSGNGREVIRERIIRNIKRNPSGYGLAADRSFVVAYSHDIFLELCVSFGTKIGSLLFAAWVFLTLKSLFHIKNDERNLLYASCFCGFGFVALFMSSSYLLQPLFYFLIGLGVRINRDTRAINPRIIIRIGRNRRI